MMTSGNVRPNMATFHCSHSFHVSCLLSYSKEKHTTMCPSCVPSNISLYANFGEDRLHAMQTIVDQRRKAVKVETGWGWFKESPLKSKIRSGTSLSDIRLSGFIPEHLVEQDIRWKSLTYKLDDLYDFGIRWTHMLNMGFTAQDFKTFEDRHYSKWDITASKMLQTSMTIRDLVSLKIPLYRLHEMKFTWDDLTRIGGNCESLRSLTDSMADLKTYFAPTNWDTMGFTQENIKKYKWEPIEQVRQRRAITAGGIVF